MKTFSGTVVVTSYLHLMVHRWIADDVPIYLKFALKVTHPFKKRRFRQNLLERGHERAGKKKREIRETKREEKRRKKEIGRAEILSSKNRRKSNSHF